MHKKKCTLILKIIKKFIMCLNIKVHFVGFYTFLYTKNMHLYGFSVTPIDLQKQPI